MGSSCWSDLTLGMAIGVVVLMPATADAASSQAPSAPGREILVMAGPTPGYAGAAACQRCHESAFGNWALSLHAQAMRTPGQTAFGGASGAPAAFGKAGAGKAALVRDGDTWTADVTEASAKQALPLRLVLGAQTMEQPLVSLDKGRYQALPVAYDPAKEQWFDIFSGEERLPGEFGHWTGRGMTANSQCIACHSTDFRKGFEVETAAYTTAWSEAGVGCEACHGPGADHVADTARPYGPFGKGAGIAAYRPSPSADPVPKTKGHSASGPPAAGQMLDVCATCHSVRRDLAEGFRPGNRLLDHFEPELLDSEIWWPDGQVRTEAYEWTSYQQSRMNAAGVNCLACHDVHSGKLKAEGNALCLSCHAPRYSEKAHTGHTSTSDGSLCVSCHMPEGVFMARDHRRDHGFSIPDPIAAVELAIPSACEVCHKDRSRETLAADGLQLWPALRSERLEQRRSLTRTFAQARQGKSESSPGIRACLRGETCYTPVLRASAARLSAEIAVDAQTITDLLSALADEEPLVRSSAAYALGEIDLDGPQLRTALSKAVVDEVLAVRLNAAWALRRVDTTGMAADQAAVFRSVFDEWRAWAKRGGDAPESWHSLGVFETDRGEFRASEAAYRKSIEMEPQSVPSRYNLAMLLVSEKRVADAKKELDALVAVDNTVAPAWYALGMIHGEEKNWTEAARCLGRCLNLDRDYPDALSDLTTAYLEAGASNIAKAVLGRALEYPPRRTEALAGLVRVSLKAGDRAEAARFARELVKADPSAGLDPTVADLVSPRDEKHPDATTAPRATTH